MSSPPAAAQPSSPQQKQGQPSSDSAATTNSPRVWFISSGCSPLVVRLIRRLLSHGDYVAACLPQHELDDPTRSRDFRSLVAECDSDRPDRSGWKSRIRSIQADGRSMGQCGAAVAEAVEAFQRIDIVLCCNSEAIIGTVEELAASATARNLVREQFETIFFSQVNLIKACLPVLRNQHNGHIMLLTSIGGHIGTPGMSIHTAATWAIEGFCDSLAYEIAPFNIRLTIVQPHKEIQSLTNRIIFAPEAAQTESQGGNNAAAAHLSVPSVRGMLTRVLNLDPETALPSSSARSTAEVTQGTPTASPNSPPFSPSASTSSTDSPAINPATATMTAYTSLSAQSPPPAALAMSFSAQHAPPPPSTTTAASIAPPEDDPRGRGAGSGIIYRYPNLPPSSLDALVSETVTALAAIGGHENPPARHIVGFEGADAVKEKLRTVTEELEDFVEASIAVDIVETEDGGYGTGGGGPMESENGGRNPGSGGAGGGADMTGLMGMVPDGMSQQMDWDGGQLW